MPFFRQHEYFNTSGAGCKGFFSLFPAGSGKQVDVQPLSTIKPPQEDQPPGAELRGHGQPHAHQPQAPHQGQGQGDAHPPHGSQADEERPLGVPGAPQCARGHDGRPEQGLGKGHDAQHLAAQVDDLRLLGEDHNELGGEEEQHRPAQGHHAHAHPGDHPGEALGQVLPPRADGLAHQGGAGHRHAGGRQVADGFRGHRQVVGRHRHGADAGDDGGDDDLGHAHDGALQGGGEAQTPGGQQAAPLELIALVQADADGGLFAEQGRQKQQAHQGGGEPRGKGSTPYAPSRAPHGEAQAQHLHRAGGVDEQGVENHVEHVDHQVEDHGGLGVPGAADDGAEHVGAQGEGHGAGHDPEVQGGVPPDGGLGAQQGGQREGEGESHRPHEDAEEDGKAQALPHHPPGVLPPAGPQVLGHLHGKADGRRGKKPVEQPGGAGGKAHRRRGLGAQGPHHGGVHVLHQGDHDLLDNGGPGQKQHRAQGGLYRRGALVGEQLRNAVAHTS